MESLHQEQASNAGNGLRMSILRRNASSLLPEICSNSSFYKITDETFPYMSGIFDETMEPSFMSNGPVATTDLPDQVQLKTLAKTQDEVTSDVGTEAKAAYSSWLSTSMEKGQSIDFSMSIASAKDDHEDISNVTKSDPEADKSAVGSHFLESAGCTEKCGMDSKNGTFDMAKDLKERFSGLNLTKPVQNEPTGSSNTTFEKSEHHQEKSSGLSCTISNDDTSVEDKNLNEKHFNSTVDVCAPLNSTTEQPNQKLNGTVDITQSDGSKQEQSNEACECRMDCEKQSTFTKAAKETDATVDMTDGVPIEVVQQGSVNVEPVEGTFTKHNTTTDLTPSQPVPDLTVDMIKNPNTESPVKSSNTCSLTVKDAPVSEQSEPPVNTTAPVRVDLSICSDRTVDLPETDCKDGQQELFGRRNGISDGEGYHNLDISQSSMFSLDEMLDLKPCPLVASTPIVLGRGFDRLQSAKPTNIQKQLSVINSINTHLNDDTAGVSEHEGSASSKTNPLFVKSDACGQTANRSSTSNSTTSEAAVVNKPPSKPAVRRKIPQPTFKSNIPKTQLPVRPTTLQLPSAGVKPKTVAAAQTANQPETSSSALHSTRRMVQLNKGKPPASAKNPSTASTVKSSMVTSSTTCNLTADKKAGNTCLTLPKPSGLQPYGRGRFGLKPPGSAVPSEATGHAQTINKPTGLSGIRTRNSLLPGFSQKHASSDTLPLAKRKKIDLQNQPSCAEAPTSSEAAEGVQKNLTPLTDITSKIADTGTNCGNCLLLQEKLLTFHKELGGFLQEAGQLPDCKKWVLLQQNLESYLEEVKNLQT
ncbi:flocculation protein FLO11-like isoform X1, partial [Clarias magur]